MPARSIFTFLLFICVCIFTDRTHYPLSVIFAVSIHEAGHLLAAKMLRVPLLRVCFTPFGIRIRFHLETVNTIKSVIVYLSGSIVSIVVGWLVLNYTSPYNKATFSFALVSLTLGLLNLMPIIRLDGGCVAESLLSLKLYPDTAYKITKIISDVFVFLFWFVTLYVSLTDGINVSMITLAVFLIFSSL